MANAIAPARYVWYAVIAFAVLALAASCMTIDYGEFLTDDVARKMHGRTVGDMGRGRERGRAAEDGQRGLVPRVEKDLV